MCACVCAFVWSYGAAHRVADAVDTWRGMKEVRECVCMLHARVRTEYVALV